jgi:hypothetical protein
MRDRNQTQRTQESSGRLSASKSVSEITVGDLLRVLRGDAVVEQESVEEVSQRTLDSAVRESNQAVEARRVKIHETLSMVGATPPAIGARFLRELGERPEEARKFLADPVEYSRSSGVLLDPSLVQEMVDATLFGKEISEPMIERLGPSAVHDLISMRQPADALAAPGGEGPVAVFPVAALAVVAAAAAVVTASNLLTDGQHPQNVLDFKGLGPGGIRFPSGRTAGRFNSFNAVASSSVVAVYGASSVSPMVVVTDAGRSGAF